MALRALASVNLAAVQRNVERLRAGLAHGATLCAVVKADASGHGAVPISRAALSGGAVSLAVATVGEAAELREAGIAAPVLILGAISAEELPVALAARAAVVAWSDRFVADLAAARPRGPVDVHIKLDSGMGRLGTRRIDEALAVADAVRSRSPVLRLAGAMTHFASADDDPDFVAAQLDVFTPFVAQMRRSAGALTIHAANSAATLREPRSHFDMVRCGIALYGCDPMNVNPDRAGLEPAMELRSYVAAVKPARAGTASATDGGSSRRPTPGSPTLPIGYADGLRRTLSNNCEVLIDGRRYPVVGTISMDNVTVDLGPARAVRRGGSRRDHLRPFRNGAPDGRGSGQPHRDDQPRGPVRHRRARAAHVPLGRKTGAVNDPLRAWPGRTRPRAATDGRSAGRAGRSPATWLVGGAVRDRLLGRRTSDFDVAVPEGAGELARKLGAAAGAFAFALSQEFGAWRVVAHDRGWQLDLIPLRGATIEDDLSRRDLTINAIATPSPVGTTSTRSAAGRTSSDGSCAWLHRMRSGATRCGR